MFNVNNLRVKAFEAIPTPAEVMKKVPITTSSEATVFYARENIQNIFDGKDKRKIIIVGPCSIHDQKAALEYAKKLNELRKKVEDKFVVIMRTYFEKPRTTVGWKGFIYDPELNDTYDLQDGIVRAREILVAINDMGLPTGTEVLGPIVIQYYSDLICWSSIGARTAESQTHRELSSGLSMPVGFKNGTEGNVDIAVNAIIAAKAEHHFIGMDEKGQISVVKTTGNPYGHLILRGGNNGPNYFTKDVKQACEDLKKAGIAEKIMIDCSHANSEKDFRNQSKVWENVWEQIKEGDSSIVGLMLESNLKEGSQKINNGGKGLEYGVSITDGCIGFEETERLIMGKK